MCRTGPSTASASAAGCAGGSRPSWCHPPSRGCIAPRASTCCVSTRCASSGPPRSGRDGGPAPVARFCGGRKARKTLPLLLAVWTRVAPLHPGARLLIAGGGPLLGRLRALAERRGLAGSVRFAGYVAEAEKADHFSLGDVFVFPSAMEGFGFAVAEAMASGLPVVASDRGSIPEVLVDGEGGFLCDPTRLELFVNRLDRLLGDSALRAKLGAANAERVDRLFRWDGCVARTRRVYADVLAAWRRPEPRPGTRCAAPPCAAGAR